MRRIAASSWRRYVSATREISDLRVLLETRLTLAAMKRITAAHYAQLDALQREFDRAEARKDREAVRALNYRFHSLLYALAQQPQTLHFAQVLWAKYPFDLINLIGGRPGRAAAEHRRLLKAMKLGDEKTIRSALREHIEAGWQELQLHLEQQVSGTPRASRKRKSSAIE